MTARASFTTRSAWLGKEFGLNFAARYFDAATIEALPRFCKGKNKGNHKATIEWIKVESGGWVGKGSDDSGALGHVERRVGQIIAARLVLIPYGETQPSEVFATYGEDGRFTA